MQLLYLHTNDVILTAVGLLWAEPGLGMDSDIRASKLLKCSKTTK